MPCRISILNIAQTAELCGISVRQLGYWTKQGYVAASGRGARRIYGLDSLRHLLAIKNAMAGGASLRQALKALPDAVGLSAEGSPPTDQRTMPEAIPTAPPEEARRARSDQERDALMADVIRLFAANPRTRDDASGLSVKIGRSVVDIRDIAEALCSRGILSKTFAQGSVVFEDARKGSV